MFRIQVEGRSVKFATLAEARDIAGMIQVATGIIVGIEEVEGK